jgi:predicted alpha-1,2-mannosidase
LGKLSQPIGLFGLFLVSVALASAPLDLGAGAKAASTHLTKWVDPFIGTDGSGHTFPGASTPFAMVAPGPDNSDNGWDFASGYQHRASRVMGFSNTHISGAGIGEMGDVLLQPAGGHPWTEATKDFSTALDKRTELARPGYYAVTLPERGVRVELTSTRTVAYHRYNFARPGDVQVLVDVQHVIRFLDGPRVVDASVQIDPTRGEISGRYRVKNWVDRETAFVLRFDRPIAAATTLTPRPGEKAPRYLLKFVLGTGRRLEARVALSTVDVAGARRNLAAEGGLAFDVARRSADQQWERLLDRVRIEAPPRQQRIFYTALYHAFLHPSDIADVDGQVRGPTGVVIQAPGGVYYSTLSLWDDVRATYPLLALVAPERIDGLAHTLLLHARGMGYLPLWTAWGRENWCMIGNPALVALAHFIAAGFHGFDQDEALAAMVATSTQTRTGVPAGAQTGWADYDSYGFLPFDKVDGESVSKSVEYAWGDDAVARVAALKGDAALADRFARRSQGWRNLFDPETRMLRGKSSTGTWRTPFDPTLATSPLNNPGDYTEANAWQYTVALGLFDPDGFVRALGGPRAAGEWLDRLFATRTAPADRHLGQEGMIGQYAQGNEPSHHVAWLYAWTDRPWRTRAIVERVARDFYSDRPDGLPGNDDAGQMSAWYVLATLGFYPEVPASGGFVASAPLVRRARLNVGGGRVLRVVRRGAPANGRAVAAVSLNGRSLERRGLNHLDLAAGGLLTFTFSGAETRPLVQVVAATPQGESGRRFPH